MGKDAGRLLRVAVVMVWAFAGVTQAATTPWRPVAAADLAMTSEPKAPNASAIVLYMDRNRDDSSRREDVYMQIKILTEDGRRHADVEITYDAKRESIRSIEARTIRRDGTIIPFAGEIFEKPIAAGSDGKVMTKTLALTDVEVGGVIEYRYTRYRRSGLYSVRWMLGGNLFMRHAHYAFRGSQPFRYGTPLGVPPNSSPIESAKRGYLTMDIHDVPAFVSEEFSPPETAIRHHLSLIYAWDWDRPAKDPEKFWKRYVEEQRSSTASFLVFSSSLREDVLRIAPETDPPEMRLRKLYAACAGLRNRSYEPERSEEEWERDDEPEAGSAREVWKHKYGWSGQIDLLFMAMAREAGFEVAEVWTADRWEFFFSQLQMDPGPLETRLIEVKVAGKPLLLSPGTKFLPFGALAWTRTAQPALRIDSKSFSWITVEPLKPEQTRSAYKAHLALQPDGSLKGKLTMTQTGQEAVWRRNRENNEDAAHRRKFLEDDLIDDLGDAAVVRVIGEPDWQGTGDFVVEFELTIPDRAIRAGNRLLLPLALFAAGKNNAFQKAERQFPIYIWYPYIAEEEMQIDLPAGWKLAELPEAEFIDVSKIAYSIRTFREDDPVPAVRVKRKLQMEMLLTPPDVYGSVRQFFESVRAGDEQHIIVERSGP